MQFKKLNMSSTIDNTEKLLNFVSVKYETGELSNDSLVQLIELCGTYLNLKTISQYAKTNKMSYNGAKNHRKITLICGVKFIVDNL